MLRQKAVLLDIPGSQCAIEVVDNGRLEGLLVTGLHAGRILDVSAHYGKASSLIPSEQFRSEPILSAEELGNLLGLTFQDITGAHGLWVGLLGCRCF